MASNIGIIIVLSVYLTLLNATADDGMSQYLQRYCDRNEDCVHPSLCCSITPALGKRAIQQHNGNLDKDFNVHYCLPYKTTNATWCELRLQYSPHIPNYHALCPCGPGLICSPTTELDPKYYPQDRFGKCVNAV